MSQSSTNQSQESHLVKLKVENALDIGHVLSSLWLQSEHKDRKKNPVWTICEFSEQGVRFTLEDPSKSFQAITFLKKEVFQDYKFTTDTVRLNLKI